MCLGFPLSVWDNVNQSKQLCCFILDRLVCREVVDLFLEGQTRSMTRRLTI